MDFSQLISTEELERDAESGPLRDMATEAAEYLSSFAWCKSILHSWLGWGVEGVCGVFLVELEPGAPEVDRWLWVIVGDLPPAYLVIDDSPTPLDALRNYVDLIDEWVTNVRDGKSLDECIPVDAPPTAGNAEALRVRIDFLRSNILTES